MGLLTDLKNLWPVTFTHSSERKTVVQMTKQNTFDLEVCTPKGVLRERPLWLTDKLDFYHLREDGTIEHTSGDDA